MTSVEYRSTRIEGSGIRGNRQQPQRCHWRGHHRQQTSRRVAEVPRKL